MIDTVSKGFPLNVMYWCKKEDGTFEVLDGQQRTISICQYSQGDFSVNWEGSIRTIGNLTKEQKQKFLDYELLVYICEGTDQEKLDWFKVINIAGEKLEQQEIRNAVYSGSWVTEAKKHFSKTGCPAQKVSEGYVSEKWIRQLGLQRAIEWICRKENEKMTIEEYMSRHQHDTNCNELWLYFNEVVNWAKATFPKKRKELVSIDWGEMYVLHRKDKLDPTELEKKISELMKDGEIQSKTGIYWYAIDGDEQHLNLRMFDEKVKTEVWEIQKGVCPICKQSFAIEEMEADHIVPWCKGGLTTKDNCQMLCRKCNRKKSGK